MQFRIIILLYLLLSHLAWAANELILTTQPPKKLISLETIGFHIPYLGDENENSSNTVRYRKIGGNWQEGHPCVRTARSYPEWAGRLFYLTPAQQYEVEVTFSDLDGVTGINPVTFTATTRSERLIKTNGGNTYHVSVGGNDNNNGSASSPFATIQVGIGAANAGDEIIVHGGTYRVGLNSGIIISKSGTVNAPLIIKAEAGETVIIAGFDSGLENPGAVTWQDEGSQYTGVYSAPCSRKPYEVFYQGNYLSPTSGLTNLVNGQYNYSGTLYNIGTYGGWFYTGERLYVKIPVNFRQYSDASVDPSAQGMKVALSQEGLNIFGDYVVIDGLIVQLCRQGIDLSGDNVVVRNTVCRWNSQGMYITGNTVLIDSCQVSCSPTYWYRDWTLGHDVIGTSAIDLNSTNGGNCIIRNSHIFGVENGIFCGSPWSALAFDDPKYNQGIVIENNLFDMMGDDAVETDGASYNFVIANNYFDNCFTGISAAPLGIGPIWAIRNTFYVRNRLLPDSTYDFTGKYAHPNGVFKFNTNGRPAANGPILIYHTTSLVEAPTNDVDAFSSVWNNTPGLIATLRNNTFTVRQGDGLGIWIEGTANGYVFDFMADYDNIWVHSGGRLAKIVGKNYYTLAALQTDGLEQNGVSEDVLFKDPQKGDFSLPQGSGLVDAGLHIPGINDGYAGSAPDIGAVEYGKGIVRIEGGQKKEFNREFEIDIFPNPVNMHAHVNINLKGEMQPYKLQLRMINGQVIFEKEVGRNKGNNGWVFKPNLFRHLGSGVYFITVATSNMTRHKLFLIIK